MLFKTLPALIGVVVAAHAHANVVSISGSLTGGPVGTAGAISFGSAGTLQPFAFSGGGISVAGTSVANNASTVFGLASGGFQSTQINVTSTDAVDFTLLGQYEFDAGGGIIGPVTFTVYSFSGNSRSRTLTVTLDAIVDGDDRPDSVVWNAALPSSFQSGSTTPTGGFPASLPTISMNVRMRVEVGAGAEPVDLNVAEHFQRAVWTVPAPTSAGALLCLAAFASRRRGS